MKGGAPVALAVGVGYILGRRRKMRLATMLALGAATGGLGRFGPAVLKRGAKYLGSTNIAGDLGPAVTDIVSTIRGDLFDAGKAAAAAAVTSRMDSLSDNLHDRAETLRNPEAAAERAGQAAGRAGSSAGRAGGSVGRAGGSVGRAGGSVGRVGGSAAGGSVGRLRGRGRGDEEPDEAEEYEEPYDESYDGSYEDEPEEPEAAEDIDTDEEEPDEGAAAPAPRRTRGSRSPVTRTRR
jgi:hypothetical protein